jgi:biopolymer transport protein ExbD
MPNRRRVRPATILPRPDMTPFVDVVLLLIVFFMWLNWLQKPNVLGFSQPGRCWHIPGMEPATEMVSLILLPDNRIGVFQRWQNDFGIARLQETDYQTLPRLLADIKRANATGRSIIFIEPTNQATFGNLVSVLTTLKRIGNLPYFIGEPTDFERRLVAHYKQVFARNPRLSDALFLKAIHHSSLIVTPTPVSTNRQ